MALCALVIGCCSGFVSVGHAQEQNSGTGPKTQLQPADPAPEGSLFNLPAPTLGGRQFWGDVTFRHGWRIQQNVFTEHFRLLDPRDVRQAWGSRAACEAELNKQQFPTMTGDAVVVIHGIIRSSKSFAGLQKQVQGQGMHVIPFDYPSTRVPLKQSAALLDQVLKSLDGVERIHLVVHSMGGLVVRTYLQEHEPDPRLNRMVMLGVPNQGAEMANIMKDNLLYKFVYGPAGQQLVADPAGVIAKLPTPKFEFAVIAGARGTPDGWNPLIPGDDDGTVSVDAARLPGAADFMTVPALHSFLMDDATVQNATIHFLKQGSLREDGTTHPIPVKDEEPTP
ncbi:MAG: alpha/beta fold hydrolase [Planctomycetaceae bacterium]|nr:alpha/beta fold hydrolase [Planctomycetaceae bacterium]